VDLYSVQWSVQICHSFYKGSHSFTCHKTPAIRAFTPSHRESPPFGRYSLCLPTEGWPGWVDQTCITVKDVGKVSYTACVCMRRVNSHLSQIVNRKITKDCRVSLDSSDDDRRLSQYVSWQVTNYSRTSSYLLRSQLLSPHLFFCPSHSTVCSWITYICGDITQWRLVWSKVYTLWQQRQKGEYC